MRQPLFSVQKLPQSLFFWGSCLESRGKSWLLAVFSGANPKAARLLGLAVHICLSGAFLLFQGQGLFAAPPLDGQVVLAGRSGQTAQEARNKLLAAAESYRGTPYRYGGIDRGGLDCSGFIYVSFKDSLAVSVPRSTSALYSWTEKISAEALQPGDLVFFITQGRNISHVGMYTGEGRFIHSASDGPETGVIYSRLDESYWQKSFAGAGRALPQVSSPGESPADPRVAAGTPAKNSPASNPAGTQGAAKPGKPEQTASSGKESSGGLRGKGFMLGLGFAPSWNSLVDRNNPLRGVSVQGRIAWKGAVFGLTLVPGFEIRPEWDDTLGVFRMAFTPSLGFDDKLRIFVGPAFTMGTPAIKMESGNRSYTGGNSWFGAAGVTVAPFSISVGKGKLDPFAELAWQSYRRGGGTDANRNADISAGLRFSTGIRYSWDL
ncbi:MAG: C40 family peptidase [Treponema sp.]|nr:C40 family peptidase [Treponema sp.]